MIMFEQWYQTYHGRPLLGGNTSRNPEHKFQYFLEHPVFGVLAALQDGRPVSDQDFHLAQTLAPDLLRFLNVHTVLVHRDRVPPDFEQSLTQLLMLDLVSVQDEIAQYEAHWPQERATATISADDPEMTTYLRQGWGDASLWEETPAVWATRPESQLLLPGYTDSTDIYLTLASPAENTLSFTLDGQPLTRQTLQPGLNHLVLPLPASPDGFPHRLDIRADHTFDPSQLLASSPSRLIGSTGVESPVHITVRSAGKDTGDFGHIYVNGVDLSPNQRGYNLVALDPTTGDLLEAAAFDTHDPRVAPRPAPPWPPGSRPCRREPSWPEPYAMRLASVLARTPGRHYKRWGCAPTSGGASGGLTASSASKARRQTQPSTSTPTSGQLP